MTDENTRHTEKMKKIKSARDRMMETKTEEKGLIVVHTGPGKGKSSSGFGMIMRCIAHEMPCAVVQFIKGNWATGERTFLTERFADECKFIVSGEGFTWETQDRERDIAAARAGWVRAPSAAVPQLEPPRGTANSPRRAAQKGGSGGSGGSGGGAFPG